LHRNYLDSRYDPVFWLLTWLAFSGIERGPIFQKKEGGKFNGEALAPETWTNMTHRLFTAVTRQPYSRLVNELNITSFCFFALPLAARP
jgi:hypothetical protein